MPDGSHGVGTWTTAPAPAETGAFTNQTSPRVLYHRLGLAPGGLVDTPARDLFDEELGEGPHQRIGAVGRGAAACPGSKGRSDPVWASSGRGPG